MGYIGVPGITVQYVPQDVTHHSMANEVKWYSGSKVVSLNCRTLEAENECREKQDLSSVVHHSCAAYLGGPFCGWDR